jgi:hypothetical protein
MKMIEQRPTDDGTIAMDSSVCVIATVTDLSYRKVRPDIPHYRGTSDQEWMRYLNLLGFQVEQVDENAPPAGHPLYCGVTANANGEQIRHAIAVDELAEYSTLQTAPRSPASSR